MTPCNIPLATMKPLSPCLRLSNLVIPPYPLSHTLHRSVTRKWSSSASAWRTPRGSERIFAHSSGFFLPNRIFDSSACLEQAIAGPRTTATSAVHSSNGSSPPSTAESLPHRRRQALRAANKVSSIPPEPSPTPLSPIGLAQDASSVLTTSASKQPPRSIPRLLTTCLSLSKPRLTILVVLSAMAPYALYPSPELLSPALTETPSLSPLTLFFLTTGTGMCSAAANALNMSYEPGTDKLMSRTRNRPIVRGLISRRGAVLFAILVGAAGTGALWFGVNPTVAGLGFANIVLYAGVYTPFKAISAVNTWIGAVVGGIPPLMGWAAAAGETATDGSWRELLFASDSSSIGGWLMAGLLFAWQFPHFMALSWPIREEYKTAGLRMLAWTNPSRNARVALRYSLAFIPLSIALCAAGVTEWSYAAVAFPINFWLAREAVKFWKHEGHKGSARGLFWASVWHLPGVMILALLCKKGMWAKTYTAVFGQRLGEEGEWEIEELGEMRSMTAEKIKEVGRG